MDEITVLIVEDSPDDTLLIKEYLMDEKGAKYSFFEADSLQTALELIPRYDFETVLLDLNLPDSKGLETVTSIVSHLPDTALIVLTGIDDDELAVQAIGYGAQDFIYKKKMSASVLSATIRYAIERKKGLQDRQDLLHDLNLALKKIELLENLLPLCTGCNRVLAEDNTWYNLEDFAGKVSATKPKNLICPQCQQSIG